jgi:signal transduction histidine kinase
MLFALSAGSSPPTLVDEVPSLMERAVLPVTRDRVLCAAVADRQEPEPDHLLTGLANGNLNVFYTSGSEVIVRVLRLRPGLPVDAVCASRLAGVEDAFAILACQGDSLYVMGDGTSRIRGRLQLPAGAGRRRLMTLESTGDAEEGPGRILMHDTTTAHEVVVEPAGARWGLTLKEVASDPRGISATQLSDRAVVVPSSGPVVEFPPASVDAPYPIAGSSGSESRRAAGALHRDVGMVVPDLLRSKGDSLEMLVRAGDGSWSRTSLGLPSHATLVMPVRDTTLLVGGVLPGNPKRQVGWLKLVSWTGHILAEQEHGRPPAAAAMLGELIAVQGEGRNLSIYDLSLRPMWDDASLIRPVAVLSAGFDADVDDDLFVVGDREFAVDVKDVEAVRSALNRPAFMAGAFLSEGKAVLSRPMLNVFRSRVSDLISVVAERRRDARECESKRRFREAALHLMVARAAASAVGDEDAARRLGLEAGRLLGVPRRERATAAASALLLAVGLWWSVALVSRRATDVEAAPVALLGASGSVAWGIVGTTVWSPALLAGAIAAGLGWTMSRLRHGAVIGVARVPGAAVEELAIGIAEFTHGGSSDVIDEARKNITTLAFFAQGMLDSRDDAEHFQMLRDRLEMRFKGFYPAKYDLLLELPEHARAAGMAVEQTQAMARGARRIRTAVEAVAEGGDASDPAVLQALGDIVSGRDELASAADSARDLVRGNPGCSVMACVTRVLDDKQEELKHARVQCVVELGVREAGDAVAIKRNDLYFVVENLVANALKAMSASKMRRLEFQGRPEGHEYLLRVADTGRGMSDTERARAFVPKETDGESGGFGLPNSRDKLRRVGGDIVIDDSEPGRGTAMLVTLPFWRPGDD